MKDAQKPDHITLNTLINRLKEGRFVIPDFQREFEWRPWDIKDLMRSIFLDYYIGSLLLWKGKKENFQALSCEIVYGYDGTTGQHPWNYGNGKPEYIVLDGQQRLTALYYAFIALRMYPYLTGPAAPSISCTLTNSWVSSTTRHFSTIGFQNASVRSLIIEKCSMQNISSLFR